MLNTKEVEATLAVEELDNEVAAAIQGGCDLQIYKHANGIDWLNDIDESRTSLSSNANDKISSVRVGVGRWIFYEHANYGGRSWEAPRGKLSNVPSWFNDKISSIRRIRT
jgi:hypothetical protein